MSSLRLLLVAFGVVLVLVGWRRGHRPDAVLVFFGAVLCAVAFGIALGQAA